MRTWTFLLTLLVSLEAMAMVDWAPRVKPPVFAPKMSRVVPIFGPIGENSYDIANKIRSLDKKSREPIYIIINSGGGEILRGSLIISAIEEVRAPVITVCTEMCASMAAMIFEYGDERYILSRSILMFHPASTGGEQPNEIDKTISRLLAVQRWFAKIERDVAKRVGLSFETYKLRSGQEIWLDGRDAVKDHFADKVVSLDLPDGLAIPPME